MKTLIKITYPVTKQWQATLISIFVLSFVFFNQQNNTIKTRMIAAIVIIVGMVLNWVTFQDITLLIKALG